MFKGTILTIMKVNESEFFLIPRQKYKNRPFRICLQTYHNLISHLISLTILLLFLPLQLLAFWVENSLRLFENCFPDARPIWNIISSRPQHHHLHPTTGLYLFLTHRLLSSRLRFSDLKAYTHRHITTN